MATDEKFTPTEKMLAQANPAFRFVVVVDNDRYAAFTECTLPSIEWEMEEIKEGGLNTRTHQLPGRRKASRVTLKYGVCKDKLWEWYKDAMAEKIERRNITIELLDVSGKTVAGWYIQSAYPVKWTGPQLQSASNAIAIQTLEFVCGEVTLDPVDQNPPSGRSN